MMVIKSQKEYQLQKETASTIFVMAGLFLPLLWPVGIVLLILSGISYKHVIKYRQSQKKFQARTEKEDTKHRKQKRNTFFPWKRDKPSQIQSDTSETKKYRKNSVKPQIMSYCSFCGSSIHPVFQEKLKEGKKVYCSECGHSLS